MVSGDLPGKGIAGYSNGCLASIDDSDNCRTSSGYAKEEELELLVNFACERKGGGRT